MIIKDSHCFLGMLNFKLPEGIGGKCIIVIIMNLILIAGTSNLNVTPHQIREKCLIASKQRMRYQNNIVRQTAHVTSSSVYNTHQHTPTLSSTVSLPHEHIFTDDTQWKTTHCFSYTCMYEHVQVYRCVHVLVCASCQYACLLFQD